MWVNYIIKSQVSRLYPGPALHFFLFAPQVSLFNTPQPYSSFSLRRFSLLVFTTRRLSFMWYFFFLKKSLLLVYLYQENSLSLHWQHENLLSFSTDRYVFLVLFLLYYHSPIVILFASLSGLQLHQMVSLFILHHTKSHLTSLCLKWIGSPAGSGGSMPGGTQEDVQIPPSTEWFSTIKRNSSAQFVCHIFKSL